MSRMVKDILTQKATEQFFGRNEEIDTLLQALEENGPLVTFVYGIGGIGKSALLNTFANRVRSRGHTIVQLDCREIEPTGRGFLRELGTAIGDRLSSSREAGIRLESLSDQVVLALDTYEVYRVMDSWLRRSFLPELRSNMRVVIFGREPPVTAWHVSPGWQELFMSLRLGPLDERESVALLLACGLNEEEAQRVNQFASGHPLALKLAAAAIAERPNLRFREVASQHVISELTRLYLEDVPDQITREALEAASVLRRTTKSLLRAMLPHLAPQDVYDRLSGLPFVENGSDGLIVHDVVRKVIAAHLKTSDPNLYRSYRYAAYRQLRKELLSAQMKEIWRYNADLLYMIEEPIIREAFFPSDMQPYAVEPARLEDGEAILAITKKQEGSKATSLTMRMWETMPQVFKTVRDREGAPVGYYVMYDPKTVDESTFLFDPIIKKWSEHLNEDPIPKSQRVLFLRRWMGEEKGELPSPIQAACWLDIKGWYMEMRKMLRRIYCPAIHVDVYGPILDKLGFQLIPEAAVVLDGKTYQSAMLDFGPGLVLGWLDGHVRAQLGVEEEILDLRARELVINGERIGLTPLEFGVITYLYEHEGEAITRTELLDHVWGYDYDGGSNVVDARVRTLRQKMGDQSFLIETVTGVGYLFRGRC